MAIPRKNVRRVILYEIRSAKFINELINAVRFSAPDQTDGDLKRLFCEEVADIVSIIRAHDAHPDDKERVAAERPRVLLPTQVG